MNLKLDFAILISILSFLFYFTGRVFLNGYLSPFNLNPNSFFDIQDYIYYSVLYNFEIILWGTFLAIFLSFIITNKEILKLKQILIGKIKYLFNYLDIRIYKYFSLDTTIFIISLFFIFIQSHTQNNLYLYPFTITYIVYEILNFSLIYHGPSSKHITIIEELDKNKLSENTLYFAKKNHIDEILKSFEKSAILHYLILSFSLPIFILILSTLVDIEQKGINKSKNDLINSQKIIIIDKTKDKYYLQICSRNLCIFSKKDYSNYKIKNINEITLKSIE
ncbi:hypothetical protein F904_03694 [Acinetobacter dispersus]|uniref:Uncharacterized protein n=1 Tax=Acinetobacter dispersus TaxID=70348 RepID=N9M9Z0_9GAMM|nr:hypothetical protein F904_03694 [Acinetobacter dispersus]